MRDIMLQIPTKLMAHVQFVQQTVIVWAEQTHQNYAPVLDLGFIHPVILGQRHLNHALRQFLRGFIFHLHVQPKRPHVMRATIAQVAMYIMGQPVFTHVAAQI
jgi:hypothetical protein